MVKTKDEKEKPILNRVHTVKKWGGGCYAPLKQYLEKIGYLHKDLVDKVRENVVYISVIDGKIIISKEKIPEEPEK